MRPLPGPKEKSYSKERFFLRKLPWGAAYIPLQQSLQSYGDFPSAFNPQLMMINPLENLKNYSDIKTLRPALYSVCSRFGSIARLDILAASQAGKRQALCFLRMDSAEQERQLMKELGVGRFGGDLVVIIELHSNEAANGFGPSVAAV